MKHAVEHASSDLAASTKIPGFRKGKVPQKVLEARVGRNRIFTEAVESHIGGWFWNAAADASIRPVSQPELDYELPTSEDEPFSFTAEFAVQAPPEVADWTGSRCRSRSRKSPRSSLSASSRSLRASVAELVPVDDRPAKDGDVLVVDLVDDSGEAQRDYVVQLGAGRLLEELERRSARNEPRRDEEDRLHGSGRPEEGGRGHREGAQGARPAAARRRACAIDERVRDPRGATRRDRVAAPRGDRGRARSRFPCRSGRQARRGLQGRDFRRARRVARRRAAERDAALARAPRPRRRDLPARHGPDRRPASRDPARRGDARDRTRARARGRRRPARDRGLRRRGPKELVREQAEGAEDDPEAVIQQLWESGQNERLRQDLRLKKALDRIVERREADPRRACACPREHLDAREGKTRATDKVVDPW